MEIREFDEYIINYYSSPDASLVARINLLSGGIGVGWINFRDEHASTPVNKIHVNGGLIINFPDTKFGDIVDILRHEEPLFVVLHTNTGNGAIRTSREPIGEEDLD